MYTFKYIHINIYIHACIYIYIYIYIRNCREGEQTHLGNLKSVEINKVQTRADARAYHKLSVVTGEIAWVYILISIHVVYIHIHTYDMINIRDKDRVLYMHEVCKVTLMRCVNGHACYSMGEIIV